MGIRIKIRIKIKNTGNGSEHDMNPNPPTILIIEDEAHIARLLEVLRRGGFL